MRKLTKATEDYLEAILLLGGDRTGVKSVDIAEKLNVSKPAVSLATANLLDFSLIEKASYGEIRLTAEGMSAAKKVLDKHIFLHSFLLKIGVPEEKADVECCELEHCFDDETINCLKKFCAEYDLKK